MVELFEVFSAWDILVLIAAMTGTQMVKGVAKKYGAGDWLIMLIPLAISTAGVISLALAGIHPWKMVPLLAGIFGMGGNVLYKGWRLGIRGGKATP